MEARRTDAAWLDFPLIVPFDQKGGHIFNGGLVASSGWRTGANGTYRTRAPYLPRWLTVKVEGTKKNLALQLQEIM